ncbi:lipopolysaccharide biosynthesis protein [Microbacterium sp. P06]|uniref:lipopolysaccharide biosynthesis protein n=1 Tax=Microbacterium sp. P06 TaxID=3366949 RepID=UPI003744DDFA
MSDPTPLWKRLLGFGLLPALAAVSPLLVLPVVSRTAGAEGWASAIAGEAVGTFAAIAIAYGWTTVGPALVSIAGSDERRGRLYRDALLVRLLTAAVALPAMAIICAFVAAPGFEWLSILMGLQGALIAMSFTWFAVGVADPRSIIFYDAIPRLAVAALAALAIAATGIVELYPLAGIAVTVVGTGVYSARLLRRYPTAWPPLREVPGLFRIGAPVALNDAALGAYSAFPTPLVTVTSSGIAAAGFASGDKMLKLGQFLPLTLANALQSWTAEARGADRRRRLRLALLAHGLSGVAGWIVLAAVGPWASFVLFGSEAATTTAVLVPLGAAFAMYSVRTSMTRHVLFPAGESRAVMWATLAATLTGVPAMIALSIPFGPVGVALGYALTETVATVMLVRRTARSLKALEAEVVS